MRFHVNSTSLEVRPAHRRVKDEHKYVIYANLGASGIWDHYCKVRDGQTQGHPSLLFYVNNYEAVKAELYQRFRVVEAAGGIVEQGEKVLFILRFGKWDLPKGHVEEGETIEETAVREVEEECGVRVSLKEKVGETWHTYLLKGRDVLKCTHWYRMACEQDTEMLPQTEEGIEAVEWVPRNKVAQTVLKNTYVSIKEIYEAFEGRD